MSGMYILSAPLLDDINTIKIGMSTNFAGRLKQYDGVFTNAFFRYIYKIDGDIDDIKEIEKNVLYKTRKLRNHKLSTEYRIIDDANNLLFFNDLIVGEINAKGLKYTCIEMGVCPKKRVRTVYSDKNIKLNITGDFVNNAQIEIVKKRLAEKLNMNVLTDDTLQKIKDKEYVIDNILCYAKKTNLGLASETMIKRIEYIDALVEIYGFRSLFDFENVVTKDIGMEKRMESSKFFEWDTYKLIMACYGKRICRSNKNCIFSVSAFVILSKAILGDFGVNLNSNKRLIKKSGKCKWTHYYKLTAKYIEFKHLMTN